MTYSNEELEYGRLFRQEWHKITGSSGSPILWESLGESSQHNWTMFYFDDKYNSVAENEARQAVDQILAEESSMSENQSYSFVSREEDVDYLRIVQEAPEGAPFILVETRTRDNQAKEWWLLVHNDILNDERVEGLVIGNKAAHSGVKTVGPEWGYEDDFRSEQPYGNYRAVGGDGSIPGYILQQIETVKRTLNPKNTRTFVSFL